MKRGGDVQLEDINLLDRDVFGTGGVPHEWFTYLRAHQPIFRHPEPHGPGFWVVSKYADAQTVSRDPDTYSSDPVAPLEQVNALVSQLRDAKVNFELNLYSGSAHGFTHPQNPSEKRADDEYNVAMSRFFKEVLAN